MKTKKRFMIIKDYILGDQHAQIELFCCVIIGSMGKGQPILLPLCI